MLPVAMSPRPRLSSLLSVIVSAALVPDPVWAHAVGGAGGMGWGDELALVLTPLILMLAIGWITLDGRRPPKRRPARRSRVRR
jgi:hypothetical protein